MRTAIFTDRDTTLTIKTTEAINIDQLGVATAIALAAGTHQVQVGAGVFRIFSNQAVQVTAPVPIDVQSSLYDKDIPPDPRIAVTVSKEALNSFFLAKSLPAPT